MLIIHFFHIYCLLLDIVACLLECQVDTNQIVACLWAVGAHCQHGAGIVGQTPGDGSILIAVGVGYRIQSRFFVVGGEEYKGILDAEVKTCIGDAGIPEPVGLRIKVVTQCDLAHLEIGCIEISESAAILRVVTTLRPPGSGYLASVLSESSNPPSHCRGGQ